MRRLTQDALAGALGISAGWATPPTPVFPLQQDPANRYHVDSNNVPFLMAGDGDWMLVLTAH
jgi:hypothetical protein